MSVLKTRLVNNSQHNVQMNLLYYMKSGSVEGGGLCVTEYRR